MTFSIRVLARAKLTLTLRILGLRPDGFHDLEALTVSIEDPHDVVGLRVRAFVGVRLSMTGRAAPGLPTGETNLAVRAAQLLLVEGEDPELPGPFAASGLDLTVHKVIPAGAGLGGGSADAAATLVAGNRLLGFGLGDGPLRDLAARLGSDVPFCLSGGTAWMRGRGEVIVDAGPTDPFPLVVAVPPFGLATPDVYRAWDALGGPRAARSCPAPSAVAELVGGELANDLEPAAEAVEPRLRPYREALEELAGAPALLAGSGSAYAVPVASPERAAALAEEAAGRLGGVAFATRPVGRGVALQGA